MYNSTILYKKHWLYDPNQLFMSRHHDKAFMLPNFVYNEYKSGNGDMMAENSVRTIQPTFGRNTVDRKLSCAWISSSNVFPRIEGFYYNLRSIFSHPKLEGAHWYNHKWQMQHVMQNNKKYWRIIIIIISALVMWRTLSTTITDSTTQPQKHFANSRRRKRKTVPERSKRPQQA